jgi:hypothetical protein
MRALSLIVAGVVAAVCLGACGGSSSNAAQTQAAGTGTGTSGTPPSTVTQTVTTPGSSTATGTTSTTSTTTAGTGSTACAAAELTPSFLGSNGAAGHVLLGFALRNHGSTACHTYGYPGVEFMTASRRPITSGIQRTTDDFAGREPEVEITLAPGQEASFRIITSDVASNTGSCPSAASLQVIAPDDTATMHLSFTPVLDCGKPTVSPLEPGTGAFPHG